VSASRAAVAGARQLRALVNAADAVGQKIMQPLVQTDASAQAERMIVLVIVDKPECEPFNAQMRQAGNGSP
jgi:hypothetical protein